MLGRWIGRDVRPRIGLDLDPGWFAIVVFGQVQDAGVFRQCGELTRFGCAQRAAQNRLIVSRNPEEDMDRRARQGIGQRGRQLTQVLMGHDRHQPCRAELVYGRDKRIGGQLIELVGHQSEGPRVRLHAAGQGDRHQMGDH